MDIFDELTRDDRWQSFYQYKADQSDMKKRELAALSVFIQEKRYRDLTEDLLNGREFGRPCVLEINKNGTDKKRTVFTFDEKRSYLLKMIAFLLRKYDDLFEENLYSFRNNTGVRRAVGQVIRNVDIRSTYSYKADIHDYFNSVDPMEMVRILREKLPQEERLISFLEGMWTDPYALKDGAVIEIRKGVMAGTPIAGFMANLYLAGLDQLFSEKQVLYARYSDDIIVFSSSETEIKSYEKIITEYLQAKNLQINMKKVIRTSPGESIEFLGFEFLNDEVNISLMAEQKIKKKLKRKARALFRWKIKKNAGDERAAKAFIRFFNKKFYDNPVHHEITWCRWYFPIITRDNKLAELDQYAIQCIRYLYTGKRNKKQYLLKYSDIQKLGYRSLVNQYWKYKNG